MLDASIISSAKTSTLVEMPPVEVSEGRALKTNNAASLSSSGMILRRDFCGLESGGTGVFPRSAWAASVFPNWAWRRSRRRHRSAICGPAFAAIYLSQSWVPRAASPYPH
jgi:hypothetical protein